MYLGFTGHGIITDNCVRPILSGIIILCSLLCLTKTQGTEESEDRRALGVGCAKIKHVMLTYSRHLIEFRQK